MSHNRRNFGCQALVWQRCQSGPQVVAASSSDEVVVVVTPCSGGLGIWHARVMVASSDGGALITIGGVRTPPYYMQREQRCDVSNNNCSMIYELG